MGKPNLTILAGPNGSGKTSIHEMLQPPGEFVNADIIERELGQEQNCVSRESARGKAGRLAIEHANQLLASGKDFVFETTLSGHHALRLMQRAKAANYNVALIFVILDSPMTNIARVKFRVRDGGHHIPSKDILRRYERSLNNIVPALQLADEWVIIDNSPRKPLFLFEKGNSLTINQFDGRIELHRRLGVLVKRALTENFQR